MARSISNSARSWAVGVASGTFCPGACQCANDTINKNAQTRYYLGLALFDLGERDDAVKELERVVQTSPPVSDPYLTLGRLYLDAGRIAEAIQTLDQGVRIDPRGPELHIQLSRAYRTKGQIDKAEARIDWNKPAREVLRHIHGLSPFPGAWSEIDGGGDAARVKILRCEPAKGAGAPGAVLDEELTIACGDGAIRIVELQRAGKAPMKAAEFLRGVPLKAGARMQ